MYGGITADIPLINPSSLFSSLMPWSAEPGAKKAFTAQYKLLAKITCLFCNPKGKIYILQILPTLSV
jgi:hypothetical protein